MHEEKKNALQRIEEKRTNLEIITDLLGKIPDSTFDKCDHLYISSDNELTLIVTEPYETLLKVLDDLVDVSADLPRDQMGWDNGDSMTFHWCIGHLPLKVWFKVPYDEIPEELLGGCKLATETVTETRRSLVCAR
jgi:hypothetical protein